MDLAVFLAQIQDSGELPFTSPEPLAFQRTSSVELLESMDERRRLEMAHTPPEFRPDCALWSARLTARICQHLVYREIPAERIEADFQESCPEEPGPAQTYSVDLVLHWLPELLRRASRIASADPLVSQLQRLAWDWPLSSVGIGLDVKESTPDLTPILENASLRQLYVDRILETADDTRLHHHVFQKMAHDARLLTKRKAL